MRGDANRGNLLPKITRGYVQELKIYQIHEADLDKLEDLQKSATDPICLSFGIFLMTVFFSYLSVLIASPMQSDKVFTVFVVIDIFAFIGGVGLLCLWLRGWLKARKSISGLVQKIRNQIPPAPEAIQELVVTDVRFADDVDCEMDDDERHGDEGYP